MFLQLSDSFRAILFYNVCHSNNTDQLPVSAEEQRGFFLLPQVLSAVSFILSDISAFWLMKFRFPPQIRDPFTLPESPLPGTAWKSSVSNFSKEGVFFSLYQDSVSQRVFAFLFQSPGNCQKFLLGDPICREHIRYFRFSAGDGSCFCQGQRSEFFPVSSRENSSFKHNAVF